MTKVFVPGQPSKQVRAGRAMSVTAGTILIVVGAILLFALTAGSPHWLNLQIVGIILILAGVLGLVIPRLARSKGSWYRRWAAPMMSERYYRHPHADELTRTPGVNGDTPTLADDLLRHKHDPPI
jgi:hypothetical protein